VGPLLWAPKQERNVFLLVYVYLIRQKEMVSTFFSNIWKEEKEPGVFSSERKVNFFYKRKVPGKTMIKWKK
jgi:hypothetical protein